MRNFYAPSLESSVFLYWEEITNIAVKMLAGLLVGFGPYMSSTSLVFWSWGRKSSTPAAVAIRDCYQTRLRHAISGQQP